MKKYKYLSDSYWNQCSLTHWNWDKTSAILQTTFLNCIFLNMKTCEFDWNFTMFLRFQVTITRRLCSNRRRAIIWLSPAKHICVTRSRWGRSPWSRGRTRDCHPLSRSSIEPRSKRAVFHTCISLSRGVSGPVWPHHVQKWSKTEHFVSFLVYVACPNIALIWLASSQKTITKGFHTKEVSKVRTNIYRSDVQTAFELWCCFKWLQVPCWK